MSVRRLASPLRIVAADMETWGGEDDHRGRDDFKNAAIKDIEAVRAWLVSMTSPAANRPVQ